MSTRLVFDIETIGFEFETLDAQSKEHLLKFAESEEDEERIKNELGFSPLTGEVVAIGIYNPDTEKGAVYYRAKKDEKSSSDDLQYVPCGDEKELLVNFWETATHYDQFVTFSGHTFDCPFLMIRSAVNKIKPTVNLLQNRYNPSFHLDLLDKLTNYSAIRGKRNLHMWAQAFGIESPKAKGVTGDDVSRLFKEKKFLEIAKYCGDDIKATTELFKYWDKYINIK